MINWKTYAAPKISGLEKSPIIMQIKYGNTVLSFFNISK